VGQEDGGIRKGDANTEMVTGTVYPIEKRNGEINFPFPNSWDGPVSDKSIINRHYYGIDSQAAESIESL
jgi:hypothetical protein